MTVSILSIGTELTRGEIVDTNSAWLAERMTTEGFELVELDTVDDDRSRIIDALARLTRRSRIVLVTGGLGPTTDDLTTAAAAEWLGVPLVRDKVSLERIRSILERAGRTMAASNEKQADFPVGAQVLTNPVGTAPGFAVEFDGTRVFFMPGVPREMTAIFDEHVMPAVRPLLERHVVQVRLGTYGVGESAVNDRLAGIEAEHNVLIGYRAHFPEVIVKVLATDTDRAAAQARARRGADAVLAQLGPIVVFGEGQNELPEVVGDLLSNRGLTLSAAESCSGGLIGQQLTRQPGASNFFQGGVIAYSNAAKEALLGVDSATLSAHGAVSDQVARAMAEGARRRFDTDLAVSVTGIAGPTGGTPTKPVGTVFIAVATGQGTACKGFTFPGDRSRVQRTAAHSALNLVRLAVLRGVNDVQTLPLDR